MHKTIYFRYWGKLVFSLISCTVIFSSDFSEAQVKPAPKLPPVCNTDVSGVQHCKYHVVNSLPAIIIDKITKDYLKGFPLMGTGNELEATDTQEISFSHKDKDIFDQIYNAVMAYDERDNLSGRTVVIVRVDVFESTNGVGTDLDIAATNASQLPFGTEAPATSAINGIDGNPMTALSFKTKWFSGFVLKESQRQLITKKSFAQVLITNLQTFNYSFTQPIYTAFQNISTVKENDLGVTFSGTVDVGGSNLNEGIILLKNPSITYGVDPNPNQISSTLTIHTPEVFLTNNYSLVYVGAGVDRKIHSSRFGFPESQSKNAKSEQKLIISLSARSLSYEQYLLEAKSFSPSQADAFLSEEKIRNLPNSNVAAEELIANILPMTARTIAGDPVLSFILKDSSGLLTRGNYNQQIYVNIRGPGKFSQAEPMALQSLVLTPYLLDALPLKELKDEKKPVYPLCISFSHYEKFGDEKAKPFKVLHLDYQKRQNKFLPIVDSKCDFK